MSSPTRAGTPATPAAGDPTAQVGLTIRRRFGVLLAVVVLALVAVVGLAMQASPR
jgi:hypothetical protein